MFGLFTKKKMKMFDLPHKSLSELNPRPIVKSLIDLLDSGTKDDWTFEYEYMTHIKTKMSIWSPCREDMHVWRPARINFNKMEVRMINDRIEAMFARSMYKSITPEVIQNARPLDRG